MAEATADVTPGSIWLGRYGGHARVISVEGGYVRFAREDGHVDPLPMHRWRFRELYLEPYDARRCRSQFSMSVANLVSFHAFYSPTARRMYARSANVPPSSCAGASRGRPALPADAIFIGTYESPVSPAAFFEDLNDALANVLRSPAAA